MSPTTTSTGPFIEGPAKFVHRPTAIEAFIYRGLFSNDLLDKWANAEAPEGKPNLEWENETCPVIYTKEGTMKVSIGDYVIKGSKGEFYPCKPDIFHLIYEPGLPTMELPPSSVPGNYRIAGYPVPFSKVLESCKSLDYVYTRLGYKPNIVFYMPEHLTGCIITNMKKLFNMPEDWIMPMLTDQTIRGNFVKLNLLNGSYRIYDISIPVLFSNDWIVLIPHGLGISGEIPFQSNFIIKDEPIPADNTIKREQSDNPESEWEKAPAAMSAALSQGYVPKIGEFVKIKANCVAEIPDSYFELFFQVSDMEASPSRKYVLINPALGLSPAMKLSCLDLMPYIPTEIEQAGWNLIMEAAIAENSVNETEPATSAVQGIEDVTTESVEQINGEGE